jgi:hypothetical protein
MPAAIEPGKLWKRALSVKLRRGRKGRPKCTILDKTPPKLPHHSTKTHHKRYADYQFLREMRHSEEVESVVAEGR